MSASLSKEEKKGRGNAEKLLTAWKIAGEIEGSPHSSIFKQTQKYRKIKNKNS